MSYFLAAASFPRRSRKASLCRLVLLASFVLLDGSMARALAQSCTAPSFRAAINLSSDRTGPRRVAVADFNKDGKEDLAVSGNDSYIDVLFGHGTGSFEPPVKLVGYNAVSLAAGDFNGDGIADLAAASGGRNQVLVFTSDGTGGFADAVEYATKGENPRELVSGDFNGDGKPDLLLSSQSSFPALLVTNGTGGFNPAYLVKRAWPATWYAVGDLNGDGKLDLLAGGSGIGSHDNLAVMLGDGTGGFTSETIFRIQASTQAVQVRDFNGDGKVDIVASDMFSTFVGFYPGDGAGGFGARIASGAGDTSIAVTADFDRDGKPDLAGWSDTQGSFRMLRNDGSGSFTLADPAAIGGSSAFLTTGDINGDGNPDLISANNLTNDLSIIFGDGAGGFAAAKHYFVPPGPVDVSSVSTGDFNGDGKLDYAATDQGGGRVLILDGNGAGGFVVSRIYTNHISQPNFSAAADFNSDGKADIAVLSASANRVKVFFPGAPTISPKEFLFNAPNFMTVGDVNGDGKLDLIVSNLSSLGLFFGDGAGSFALPKIVSVDTRPTGVAVGDFNSDGKADLAVANQQPSTVSILLGDGAGNFSVGASVSVAPSDVVERRAVLAADLNNDGKPDLAVANHEQSSLAILLGDGIGGFGAPTAYGVAGPPEHILASDFNLDGKLDFALLNTAAGSVSILLGEGAGVFSKPFKYGVGSSPRGFASGDFNGDSKADLITANYHSQNLTILFGEACRPPDVVVSKTHRGDFAAGSQGSYRLKVSNTGLSRTEGATTLTDTLPAGLSFVSAQGSGWSCSGANQSVMCTHDGPLKPGESSVVTLNVMPDAGAVPVVVNSVTVSNPSDANPNNNTAQDSAVVSTGGAVSGRITDESGAAIAGMTVVLSGARKSTTTTNSNGVYSFSGLPENFGYTVTPSRTAAVFTPVNRHFPLLRGSNTADFRARSQTNGRIAFTRNVQGNLDIYTMNSDGSGVQRLTSDPAEDTNPAWSPDGRRIAFQRNTNIFLMDGDGGNLRQLTTGEGYWRASSPVWSPDGQKIAFINEDYTGGGGVYVINGDGSNQKKIHRFVQDWRIGLSWSPDGLRIALSRQALFVGFRQGNFDIHFMDTDGRNFTAVTAANNTSDYDPDFSPDGTKLTYVAHNNDVVSEVAVSDVDGSNESKLLRAQGNPSWSPDGAKIVFTKDDDIFTMNPDGSELTNLTNSTFSEREPDWQPIINFPPVFPNPIEDPGFFVRQHYLDFLTREPDPAGLSFWTNQITACGGNTSCTEIRRINASAAFFLSIEFQETGYFVYRTYKAALGNLPGTPVPLKLNEFFPDTQMVGQGVVVGVTGWQENLETNKHAFAKSFITRSRFMNAYPGGMSKAAFVDALYSKAGVTPSAEERAAAINEFGSFPDSGDHDRRARVLRRVAENPTFTQREKNSAFVLMQYFGYLRRNPNDAPDSDFGGYNFWLGKLNQFDGNFVTAEMVKAFLISGEYKHRFGQ